MIVEVFLGRQSIGLKDVFDKFFHLGRTEGVRESHEVLLFRLAVSREQLFGQSINCQENKELAVRCRGEIEAYKIALYRFYTPEFRLRT